MNADGKAIIRPRTTGEVLDDAWRLALADGPLLLALSALFLVPAASVLVVLLTRTRPDSVFGQLLLPCLGALLLPLTGLGSGACQEVFRRRAEGLPVGPGVCLLAALRQGLEHVAARALVLLGAAVGLLLLGLPLLAVWVAQATVHPTLSGGRGRFFEALGEVFTGLPRQSGKATAVTLIRLPLLAFAALNLYFLIHVVLGTLGALTPLDTALTATQLELENPVFLAGLFGLAWILLTPYAEACNHLLYLDARVRSEGLDLWFRVRRAFRTGAAVVAVALLATPAIAAPPNRDTVRQALATVERIRAEVAQTDPYSGGRRWVPRLEGAARTLDPTGSPTEGPYRWFHAGIQGFADRGKTAALQVLSDLATRLALAEENLPPSDPDAGAERPTPEEIKNLLPQRTEDAPALQKPPRPEERPERDPVRREDDVGPDGPGGPRGPGIVGPAPSVGFGPVGWFLLGGMFLAVVVLAVVLFILNRPERKSVTAATTTGPAVPAGRRPTVLQDPADFWREAEMLAGRGAFLEALRSVYLAVLAGLHRAGQIRYEPMRTNGDYARMLRVREADLDRIQRPFRELTRLFEQKWYGDRPAEGVRASREDYTEGVRLGRMIVSEGER